MNWALIGDGGSAVFFTALTWWYYIHPRGARLWQSQPHPTTVDYVLIVPWTMVGYWSLVAWHLVLPAPPGWIGSMVTWSYLWFLVLELFHLAGESRRDKRRPNR